MQTFLPYPDYPTSAACLDRQRLGKQRVEAYQILRTLLGESSGWQRHPAVLMWKGYERSLLRYAMECCKEWEARGYMDTVHVSLVDLSSKFFYWDVCRPPVHPWWLGRPEFHSSHRAALLFKLPEHYSQFGWAEEPRLAYWWPTKQPGRGPEVPSFPQAQALPASLPEPPESLENEPGPDGPGL